MFQVEIDYTSAVLKRLRLMRSGGKDQSQTTNDYLAFHVFLQSTTVAQKYVRTYIYVFLEIQCRVFVIHFCLFQSIRNSPK